MDKQITITGYLVVEKGPATGLFIRATDGEVTQVSYFEQYATNIHCATLGNAEDNVHTKVNMGSFPDMEFMDDVEISAYVTSTQEANGYGFEVRSSVGELLYKYENYTCWKCNTVEETFWFDTNVFVK